MWVANTVIKQYPFMEKYFTHVAACVWQWGCQSCGQRANARDMIEHEPECLVGLIVKLLRPPTVPAHFIANDGARVYNGAMPGIDFYICYMEGGVYSPDAGAAKVVAEMLQERKELRATIVELKAMLKEVT